MYILKKNGIIHAIFVFLFYTILYLLFFSSALLKDKLLAPGDGIIYYLPQFYWGFDKWSKYIFSGFPQFADPQVMMWYLPKILLSKISWNAFVLSAYIFAGCFTYSYIYKLTKSKYISLFSGITYSMSGFFMAHLAHINMIHAASWLPLILLGLHTLKEEFTAYWFGLTAFAITMCILAGHPQIMVYCLGLSGMYILMMSISKKGVDLKYIGLSLCTVILGIMISFVQLLPTYELSKQSLRSQMTFEGFNEYSLSIKQSIQLLYPYLFGGTENYPYFGPWNLTELTGYIGWIPLILIAILFNKDSLKNKQVLFWLFVLLFSFLCTLGDHTPLSKLVYHIPGYNLFKVPARHFLEFSLAVTVLSSMSLKLIFDSNRFDKMQILRVIVLWMTLFVIPLICLFIYGNDISEKAKKAGNVFLGVSFFGNMTISIPIIISFFSILALGWMICSEHKKSVFLIICIILIMDLMSFGYLHEWKYASPSRSELTSDNGDVYLKTQGESRIGVVEGVLANVGVLRPVLSQMYGINSINGYGPLILSKYSLFSEMQNYGAFDMTNFSNENRVLDLLSVKRVYVSLNRDGKERKGIFYSQQDLNVHLSHETKEKYDLLVPGLKADKLYVVATLGNSTHLSDMSRVAEIKIIYSDGTEKVETLRAGRDVSEWAYDREDVRGIVRHGKAKVFEDFVVQSENKKEFLGHKYLAEVNLVTSKPITRIEFSILTNDNTALEINKVSLYDSISKQSHPIDNVTNMLSNKGKWHYLGKVKENVGVFENLNALPRAWFVDETKALPEESMLTAIKTSILPDGQKYDPSQIALLDENISLPVSHGNNTKELVDIETIKNDYMRLKTSTSSAKFLVLSDIYYPGWKAYIDGKEVPLYKTNYILRGMIVPQGDHNIELKFEPRSFEIGARISILGCLVLFSIFLFSFSKSVKGRKIWKFQR